ncbi:MAG: ABC transporter ATP-binding protein [candidate division WOR-3 bacterium]
MKEIVVETGNLYKKFGSVIALENITLKFCHGEIVGLCGPNGSGKSTFLRVITGIVKPTRGYITVFGKRPSKKARKKLAYVSENDVLYKWMRVHEIIEFMKGFYSDFDEKKVKGLLETEGIQSWKKVGELSRGLRQRLKIILAISRDPELILLDEPFSGIDMVSRERIKEMLKEFLIGGERTAIISTHFVEGIEEMFERVVFFKGGSVVLDENCENLRTHYGKSVKSMYFEIFGG